MFKLWATLIKDFRILTRDKVGLILMFVMPILLVVVITSIQDSTFELVNDNKVPLLLANKDSGKASIELIKAIEKIGMFQIHNIKGNFEEKQMGDLMHKKDALVAIVIPSDFLTKFQKRQPIFLPRLSMTLV